MYLAASIAPAVLELVTQLPQHTYTLVAADCVIPTGPFHNLGRVLTAGGSSELRHRFFSGRPLEFAAAHRELCDLLAGDEPTALAYAIASLLIAYEGERHAVMADTIIGPPDGLLLPPLSPEELFRRPDDQLFSPEYPEEALYYLFAEVPFRPLGLGYQCIVYACGGYVLKIPYARITLNEKDQRAVHHHPFLGPVLRTANRITGNASAWRWVKRHLKTTLHRFRAQHIVDELADLRPYQLGIAKAPDLLVPCRSVDVRKFSLPRRQLVGDVFAIKQTGLLQRRVVATLGQALQKAMAEKDYQRAKALLDHSFNLQVALWGRGLADLDSGVNILANHAVEGDATLKLMDAGALSDDQAAFRYFAAVQSQRAAFLLNELQSGKSLRQVVDEGIHRGLRNDWDVLGLLMQLQKDFAEHDLRWLSREFLQRVVSYFNEERILENWQRDITPA